MNITVNQRELLNGLRIVEKATTSKGLRPVLENVLIETINQNSIQLTCTDLDLTIICIVDNVMVLAEGAITISAKKFSEIVSKVDGRINIQLLESGFVEITAGKSNFKIMGISKKEFPKMDKIENDDIEKTSIELKSFINCIKKAGYCSATYESNNLLSGVVCDISENVLEMASTDGNRLARIREKINNNKKMQVIIPSKTLNEFLKLSSNIDSENIDLIINKTKIILQTEKVTMVSRLMEGQYPKYNQLIPNQFEKEALVNVQSFLNMIERVAVMVNEKTNLMKLIFDNNTLSLIAESNEIGNAKDEIECEYSYEKLQIAFNYRYILDCLKNINTENVKICLNETLTATIFQPENDEDYKNLIMPVAIRS